jgi:tetratricopeptide (TPR) repeat protein
MITVLRSFLLLLPPAILYAEAGLAALRPLHTPATAVLNPALVDVWTQADEKQLLAITFRIEPDGDTGYRVMADRASVADRHPVQLGGETIADMTFAPTPFLPQINAHNLARPIEGKTLHADWLDGKRLVAQIERRELPRVERVSEGWSDDVLGLTWSTTELRQFVPDCPKRPDAFQPSTYERADPARQAGNLYERSSGATHPEDLATALKDAQEAVNLIPGNPDYWRTLEAAQYRAEDFSAALAALTRAALLRQDDSPEDLAFRAMAHHQLGEVREAAKLLGELRKMLPDSRGREDQDLVRLFHEGEALIAPKGK